MSKNPERDMKDDDKLEATDAPSELDRRALELLDAELGGAAAASKETGGSGEGERSADLDAVIGEHRRLDRLLHDWAESERSNAQVAAKTVSMNEAAQTLEGVRARLAQSTPETLEASGTESENGSPRRHRGGAEASGSVAGLWVAAAAILAIGTLLLFTELPKPDGTSVTGAAGTGAVEADGDPTAGQDSSEDVAPDEEEDAQILANLDLLEVFEEEMNDLQQNPDGDPPKSDAFESEFVDSGVLDQLVEQLAADGEFSDHFSAELFEYLLEEELENI